MLTNDTLYPRLKHFLMGYFHQNWRTTHDWKGREPSCAIVVEDFQAENPSATVDLTRHELQHLMDRQLSEEELRQVVNRELKCSIYAPGLGMTYQAWLESVLSILEAPAEA